MTSNEFVTVRWSMYGCAVNESIAQHCLTGGSTRHVDAIRLIRKSSIDPKRRVHVSRSTLGLVNRL
jgi:hypothetical protein